MTDGFGLQVESGLTRVVYDFFPVDRNSSVPPVTPPFFKHMGAKVELFNFASPRCSFLERACTSFGAVNSAAARASAACTDE